MNTHTVPAYPIAENSFSGQQELSIWRRMFDAWVRSYDARISDDGKVMFIGL